jgi:hypothetical protein
LFTFVNKNVNAQVIWTEDFSAVPSPWTLNVPTGFNDPDANEFFISDDEGGGITPDLGAPLSCGVALNGNNTLHITSPLFGGGAIYFAGGICIFGICVTTNVRAESPIINCTGNSNISVTFNYIENGDANLDDAMFWYFDGATWTMIDNMPKTLTGCGGQGLWTSRTVQLPASANNNPNVRIGFGWVNNDDGFGSDPSFAVDDIVVSGNTTPAYTISTGPLSNTNICVCSSFNVAYNATGTYGPGNVFSAELSDATGSFASPTIIGTLVSNANSGNIPIDIPCNQISGNAYRIRVVASVPSVVGTDNGTNLSIIQIPAAPSPIISNPAYLCTPGGTVDLTAYSSAPFINWFDAPTGGNYIGTTTTGANFPVSLTSTTTYYAESLVGSALSGSSTFNFTGGMQTFIVPPGITDITIECYGAQGATASGIGGEGGFATGSLAVVPGQVLNIFVGGQATGSTGGYNGGGDGADNAGGGGGASDVRVGGTALANRVIVAGGGGGGGAQGCPNPYPGGNGGQGGGGAGTAGANSPSGGGGQGGTLGAGGAQGIGCINFLGSPGTVPNGGAGQTFGCVQFPGGGGGGGGYQLGGGGGGGSLGTVGCVGNDKGGGGGGAGGSNFTGGVTNGSSSLGGNLGGIL